MNPVAQVLTCTLATVSTLLSLSAYNVADAAAATAQHATVVAQPKAKVPGEKYRACILHRESRGNYKADNGISSGAYQFTQATWNITAKRAGWKHLMGKRPARMPAFVQDRMYYAAWRHGNGKFYWSARWGATYACFPGDVMPVPKRWR